MAETLADTIERWEGDLFRHAGRVQRRVRMMQATTSPEERARLAARLEMAARAVSNCAQHLQQYLYPWLDREE